MNFTILGNYFLLLQILAISIGLTSVYSNGNTVGKYLSKNNSHNSRNYALFFSINDYSKTEFNNLIGPIRESKSIAMLLSKYYGFQTEVLENLTREQIESKLLEYRKRTFEENDQLFVFFSGHGVFNSKRLNGYFVPSDTLDSYKSSFMEYTTIGNMVNVIPCNHILLAIDACYSGTISREIALKGEMGQRDTLRDINQRLKFIKDQLTFRSRLYITSGGKNKTPDPSEFANGILSSLRKTITSGDRILCFEDLLGKMNRLKQKPQAGYLLSHNQGGFVFVSKKYKIALKDSIFLEKNKPDFVQKEDSTMFKFSEEIFLTERFGCKYYYRKLRSGKSWIMQNLNFDANDSYCYEGSIDFCDINGRLYTWNAAKMACKELGAGWRLPLKKDWEDLINKTNGLSRLITGNFKLVAGGFVENGGTAFKALDWNGYYWTSDGHLDQFNQASVLIFDKKIREGTFQPKSTSIGASCRCVKDDL